MPSQSENLEDRDARLEKLALERDQAVVLLRRWMDGPYPPFGSLESKLVRDTTEFLESLT